MWTIASYKATNVPFLNKKPQAASAASLESKKAPRIAGSAPRLERFLIRQPAHIRELRSFPSSSEIRTLAWHRL